MGYAVYEINRFDSQVPMQRGYGVRCKCHHCGCRAMIDRGISYLCYSCGWYFCEKHRTFARNETTDEAIELDCFAGTSSQVCERCAEKLKTGEWK
jgi:hypothetical protein